MDDARLHRIMQQHARATRAWGVDALPVSGRAPSLEGAAPQAADASQPAVSPAAPPTPAQDRTPEPEIVVKASIPAASRPPAPIAGDDRASREAALDAIRARYEADAPHQHFPTDHTKIVFGDGDPCARLMFVGEAPGADEDRIGRPFVGRAGQLLDKMIVAMGLQREDVYIANVLKTRPPNNDTPTPEQARLCAPYLFAQIAIVRPEAIVTLGLPSTRLLLGTDAAMGRVRGAWAEFMVPERDPLGVVPRESLGARFAVMPTYHPAYLLRSYTPDNRQKVWSDLKMVMERLGLA